MHARIIMAESHFDPIAGKIYKKLVPLLKATHPEWKLSFLDEMSPETTIESYLGEINECTYSFVRAAISVKRDANIDLTLENLSHPYFSTEPGKPYVYFTKRFFANLAFRSLLETLKVNHIEYRGMDSELMSTRDNRMAVALAEQQGVVFSRIGLAHAEGVYSEMLKQLPPEAICMYNIFSQPPIEDAAGEWEKQIRSGEKSFMKVIDAINKSELELDKIVATMLADIEKRALLLRKLEKPDKESLPENFTAASSFVLFKSVSVEVDEAKYVKKDFRKVVLSKPK